MPDNQISITMADVQELIHLNPLAAEQLRGLALARVLGDKERELASMKAQLDQLQASTEKL